MAQELTNLEQLLETISEAAANRERVSLGLVVEKIGRRAFGPLLLLAGAIALSPLSGIPGMPTLMATLVLLIAVQLLLHRKHFWLPQWLLRRSITGSRVEQALQWLHRPARFIDRWLRPRLTILVSHLGLYVIVIVCMGIALTMPVMEPLPFMATSAGAVLSAFGLALVAHDGLLALIAHVLTTAIFGLVVYNLFWL